MITAFMSWSSENNIASWYRVFSHDVTAAILVFQNNETVAMLVYQTNPVGVELFSYVNTSFSCFRKFACVLATWVKTLYRVLNTAVLCKGVFAICTEGAKLPKISKRLYVFLFWKNRLRAVSLLLRNPWGRTQNKWVWERDYERDMRAASGEAACV